jgi:putative transposase
MRAALLYPATPLGGTRSDADAKASIGRYLDFYNGRRPHSSLDDMTPDQAYFTSLPLRTAA